jgi:hypothetical protein
MQIARPRILVLITLLALLCPFGRAEQTQKNVAHPAAEDRIKKLEERADAAEKTAAAAAMEKEYILRTQQLYESYYAKTLTTQLWALGIVCLLLTGVFALVTRFSLNLFEQRTKLAITDATTQLRNDYARVLSKEVQKLWESNAADNRKLKDALTAQTAEFERNVKDRSEFQMQFVQGLAAVHEERLEDCVACFRQALAAYKAGKPRNLMETKAGATTARYIFESLRKKSGESCAEKAGEELGDSLYNGMEEELALAALQSEWLAPLIMGRNPAPAPAPEHAQLAEPASEARPTASAAVVRPIEIDPTLDAECECRLITT